MLFRKIRGMKKVLAESEKMCYNILPFEEKNNMEKTAVFALLTGAVALVENIELFGCQKSTPAGVLQNPAIHQNAPAKHPPRLPRRF